MVEMEETVKWVSDHYSSSHSILLVGDGDFSFSLSLASSFGSGSNIVATSLDSHEALLKKYSKAQSNLEKLKELEATILHEVDATKMKLHPDLKMRKFDRIVFNFPHAGFKGKEDELHLIKSLILGFFKNSRQMLRPYGEIHVSHKTGEPYNKWNLEELAISNSLFLTGLVHFDIKDYPGYNNKRGDGKNCDEPFHLGECNIFKFRLHLSNLFKPLRVQRPPFVPPPLYVEFHNFVPPSNVFGTDYNVMVHGTVPTVSSHVNNSMPNFDVHGLVPTLSSHVNNSRPTFVVHGTVSTVSSHVNNSMPNIDVNGTVPTVSSQVNNSMPNFDVNGMVPTVSSHVNNFKPKLGFGGLINESREGSMLGMVLGYIEEVRIKTERQSYDREMHERMLYWPPTQLYANL